VGAPVGEVVGHGIRGGSDPRGRKGSEEEENEAVKRRKGEEEGGK
jgi:hypothetical protein